jgi:cytochrome o ubiquinol oxidase subunit IV
MKTHSTLRSYITGFILSIVFTLLAYFAVVSHLVSGGVLIVIIIGFAIVQLMVQLIFFLHIGQESKPRWNLTFFLSTASIVLLIVVASLWIMNHLNYNMMSPASMDQQILKGEGIQK